MPRSVDKNGNSYSFDKGTMLLHTFLSKLISSTIAASLLAGSLLADPSPVLHEGTPVRLKLARTVSSATAQEGERVDFETLDQIKLNEQVVVPAGSVAQATITEAVSKRRMARGGKLNMNIDYVRLPNGDKLALRGVQNVKGGGHGVAMTSGMVATAIVFWPAAPLFLFMQGKDISIPEGHEVTVYTNSDYAVRPADMIVANDSKPARAIPLHDVDILKLMKAGFSEQMILAKIQSSPGMYELGTDDLWRLKAAGVSENIMMAMISTLQR